MENNLNNTQMDNQKDNTSSRTDCTSVRHSFAITPEQLRYILAQGKIEMAEKISKDISTLFEELTVKMVKQRFVKMENKKVWCDRAVSGLYPRFECLDLPLYDTETPIASYYPGLEFEGFHFDTMTEKECRRTFNKESDNPYVKQDGNIKGFSRKAYHECDSNAFFLTRETQDGRSHVLGMASGNDYWWNDDDKVTLVPIHRLQKANAGPMSFPEALTTWLELGLIPEGLTEWQKRCYIKLMDAYPTLKQYITWEKKTIIFQSESFHKAIKNGQIQDALFSYDFCDERLMQALASGKKTYSGTIDVIQQELLNCDKKRADLEPYETKQLTDLSLGHWDLFEEEQPGELKIALTQGKYFVARPPQMDVMTNAVCAIDFGTKSTVVACRDQDERLLRVGEGDYTKAAELEDYENPTVIELCNINAFLAAYRAREGRPFTEWEQVTVSHEAENALKHEKNSMVYYSVFSELKQWANDKNRRMMLRDRQGNFIELKPFAELQEGDFDPIELYAYYLGLNINNMHRRIYLDYILSFPVTYSMEVREHIRQSFERGLRKSLPVALLKDEEMMSHFRVYPGASEPAAYAISALQEFGLEPKIDGEEVSYAVFDFGGGTTDYDFGIERIPKDHRSSRFVIERLGRGGGDPYLGGENILALLAYEVYKDNITKMREKRIPFVLPAKGKLFAGAEMLVKETKEASQQAHMNSKWLSEILRDVWEQNSDYKKKFEEGGTQTIPLFSSDSAKESDTVNVDISINLELLEKCIEDTIRAGVEDFFTEMMHAFEDLKSKQIHIFLAGNSCKSPVVKKLFEEYIVLYEKKFADNILKATSKEKKTKGLFVLHLPLGMPEDSNPPKDSSSPVEAKGKAKKKMPLPPPQEGAVMNPGTTPENHEQLDLDKVRTGKTGVVFGLLRSRKGGRDVKIEERDIAEQQEIIFPYYLGDIDRSNHFHVRIGRDIPYGKWVEFLPADEAEFELYYTKEARSLENNMLPQEVKWGRFKFNADEAHADKSVYICKATPNTIKYAVGDAKTNFDEGFQGKIYTQTLR